MWVRSGTGAAYDSTGMTVAGGSDDSTDEESVSVVPVTGATVVGTGTHNSSSVGCLVSSLNVAPRLLNTRVSVTSTEEL